MKLLLALLAIQSLVAQTPGTITKTATKLTAVAGTVTCVMTRPGGMRVNCKVAGGVQSNQTATPGLAAHSGIVGNNSNGSDSVTWTIQQPSQGVFTYQVTANGAFKEGTF